MTLREKIKPLLSNKKKRELDRVLQVAIDRFEEEGEGTICATLHIVAAAMLADYDVELALHLESFVSVMEAHAKGKGRD